MKCDIALIHAFLVLWKTIPYRILLMKTKKMLYVTKAILPAVKWPIAKNADEMSSTGTIGKAPILKIGPDRPEFEPAVPPGLFLDSPVDKESRYSDEDRNPCDVQPEQVRKR